MFHVDIGKKLAETKDDIVYYIDVFGRQFVNFLSFWFNALFAHADKRFCASWRAG